MPACKKCNEEKGTTYVETHVFKYEGRLVMGECFPRTANNVKDVAPESIVKTMKNYCGSCLKKSFNATLKAQ